VVPPWEWSALAVITIAAAVLRLLHIGQVTPDPFYDAAVRSMGLSWHNFFFGAFEPAGSVSIDKPPVDLWLQVASTKALGYSSTTLKLPEAFAGIAAVPLLFAAVRRMWSAPAALVAALAIAVLPVEVITSRSDTMDGVMMALIVLALLLLIRACETGSNAWLFAAAAALGLAFDVKLLESLVALPGLAVLAYLGLPGHRRRRLLQLGAATAVYVVVALSWLTATLLAPAHDRPWAIGSTNGSAWNAAFVFNGTERISGKSNEPQGTVYEPGRHYPEATQSQRDHIPIVPPSAARLLARIGPLSGERLGLELLAALLLGVPALIFGVLSDRDRIRREAHARGRAPDADQPDADTDRAVRLRRAAAVGLTLWMLTGIVLFSDMTRLHPRYVEGFLPPVAALLGIGVAWVAFGRGRARLIALVVSLVAVVYYVERLLYGRTGVWWITLVAALGAIAFATLALVGPGAAHDAHRGEGAGQSARSGREELLAWATLLMVVVTVLSLPLSADVTAIDNHVTDAGYVGALPTEELQLLSSYLRAHQGHARYEVTAESATQIGALIVKDVRPVVILTTYGARVFTTVPGLERLIARGEVKYAFLNSKCGHRIARLNAACSAPARWVRAHGTDVSAQAGLAHSKVLWLLPGATG
jgi:4-amino-4-deoxy-L-arabinose transferase-like glycosyltransferase